ncbi:MAG: tyrosine--tRNA ligase [Patescibacteria group bacterium]
MKKQDQINELLSRGVAEVIGREELEKKLKSKKLRIKLGIDPTSPNLHIGRAVALLKLRDFQQLGHTIVLIIGDFTGVIGDTSDKDSERPMLSPAVVKKNLATYREQASKILDMSKVEFQFNSKWLKKLGFWEICEQADVFSLAEFIARENVAKRLNNGTRISLREVLYPLMQGYDSVVVKSDVEVGGTDQRFNMLAGRDLQRHYGQGAQSVVTVNLITGTDGRKMSSSWGNTINLTDTPDDMYGKVMSIPDELIIPYLIHCTRVPLNDVSAFEKNMQSNAANPRDIKMILAREIVTLYHGTSKALRAEESFVQLFQKKQIPESLPTLRISHAHIPLADLLIEARLASSKTEARRLIGQRSVSINDVLIDDVHHETIIPQDGIILKKGKRHFVKVVTK